MKEIFSNIEDLTIIDTNVEGLLPVYGDMNQVKGKK